VGYKLYEGGKVTLVSGKIAVNISNNEVIENSTCRHGIVDKLEKAHIYIEQLHNRNKQLEEKAAGLEEKAVGLEERIARLEALLAGKLN
jgi:hypothetical protein